MPTESKRARRPNSRGGAVAILLLGVLLAACAYGVGSRLFQERASRKKMAALQAQAAGSGEIIWIELAAPIAPAPVAAVPETAGETGAAEAEGAVSEAALCALAGENEDFVGWLRLPGTKVDYPVMQTPDRPHYYLRRGFDGTEDKRGLPFIDESCDLAGNLANLILYGHNMKDGSMFGELKELLDPEFYSAHRDLTFDRPGRPGQYRIVSVYLTALDREAQFQFYRHPNLLNESDYCTYAENVLSRSVHPLDTPLQFGDELLTLVTCSKHAKDGRLIAVAKRV